ncbi:hypothetical protein V8E36_002185 [Tilletia maclaganii]
MADTQEPVFKKRKRGPAAATAAVTATSAGDDTGPSLHQLRSAATHSDDEQGQRGDAGEGDEDEQSTSVQDLILLRQLAKRPTGIELNKLNKGERKKKKKAAVSNKGGDGPNKSAEEKWAEQMARGGLMNGAGGGADEDEDDENDKAGSKRIVRNNFQGETNIVDVDKHMMAYIEEEMRKRSGRGGSSDVNLPSAEQVRAALTNPEDELYRVAEKYRDLQTKKVPREEEEGNVTLSTTMLTSIPEIDLGMDVRLKNIEETEKAKRLLADQRKANGGRRDENDDQFAAARFYRPKYSTQSDVDALKMAREGIDPTAEINPPHGGGGASSSSGRGGGRSGGGGDRRAMATDEMVMERFKKRQRQQLK